ncbi:amidohydrolase family protein [Sciscionella sediminilitoris]|uniref:amidohydrolase family protein n=1 Tax=Sciscionella sediminilitoris TaxID=1445613 RepID=UPI0004DF29C6|nr:amidohydrolase family protein [Sciscionella sp. SE31]
MSGRIDVHQHLIPPAYRELLDRNGKTAGGWPMPDWDAAGAIAMMDGRSIATGILSISSPGVYFGENAAARDTARMVNEYTGELVKDRPDRFGMFASLPLPDVDGALAELGYALDELGADGVVLLSNVEGRYLGDPEFEPLWAELNARAATVFVHPDAPALPMLDGLPSPLLDFPFDTTRTALQLVTSGIMGRYPRVKVILSHAGGFLPYAAYRFTGAALVNPGLTPEGVYADLRRFYFDTALSASETALPALLAFAEEGHVCYGSDAPFAPDRWGSVFDAKLDEYQGYRPGQLTAINRGNAEGLFPRLR